MSRAVLILLCFGLCACAIDRTGEGASPEGDAGPLDAALGDAERDAPADAGTDAGSRDSGMDAGAFDGGDDAGIADDGGPDGGADAGGMDAGPPDAAPPDTGPPDAGPPDAGPPDAGPPDAGPVPGGALDFDGSNDRVSIRRDVDADFTMEAWIQTTASRSGSQHYEGLGLLYADVAGGADDFGTAILNDHFAFGVGNPDQTIESTTTVTTGAWFHVAAVRTRSTGRISVFVDGTREATLLASNTGLLDARSSVIFGGNTIDSRYFRGIIDEVRIWNVARTGAQIRADMNRRLTGTEPGLIGYYRFDDGSGATATDSSPTGNDGTLGAGLIGRPTWVMSDAPIYP